MLIVFAYIFINGIQNHLSRSWCFGLLLPTVVAGLFFLVSVAAGFAGAARRVPSVLLQTDFNSVFFSAAVGVCTVPVVVILFRSLSCGLRSA